MRLSPDWSSTGTPSPSTHTVPGASAPAKSKHRTSRPSISSSRPSTRRPLRAAARPNRSGRCPRSPDAAPASASEHDHGSSLLLHTADGGLPGQDPGGPHHRAVGRLQRRVVADVGAAPPHLDGADPADLWARPPRTRRGTCPSRPASSSATSSAPASSSPAAAGSGSVTSSGATAPGSSSSSPPSTSTPDDHGGHDQRRRRPPPPRPTAGPWRRAPARLGRDGVRRHVGHGHRYCQSLQRGCAPHPSPPGELGSRWPDGSLRSHVRARE